MVERSLRDLADQLHRVPSWWPSKSEALLREGQYALAAGCPRDAEAAWLACLHDDPLHPTPTKALAAAVRELIVADTRTPLPVDVTLHSPTDGGVELACHTEVDRVALGIRGARGMVPRAVKVDVTITLRRAIA